MVPLDYTPANGKQGGPLPQKVSVGVYQFQDLRGWEPSVAGRQIRLITAELPITTEADVKANKEIRVFVAEAIKKELETRQLSVSTEGEYAQVVTLEEFSSKLKNIPLTSDRVILGRIKYFNWLEPGFAGLLFQGAMPNGKAYIDLDLIVVDPKTFAIKWAGQAFSKVDSGTSWGVSVKVMGDQLATALGMALNKTFSRADFWESLLP
jgi:hypothetical protein